MNATIHKALDSQMPHLTKVRRRLHAQPELSGGEFKTTEFLLDWLRTVGMEPRSLADNRGLVVDLGDPNASRRLVIRADIDAIPVQDTKSVDYRSDVENVMHACGHDAHSTMLLGALSFLNESWFVDSNSLASGKAVRAIFQPEEETARGAKSLIDQGVLEKATAIFGLHVDPSRPVGTVGLKPGVITAHCDEVTITVTGKGGHAARPHQCIDPIFAAAQFLTSVYGSVNRNVDSQKPVVLTFGKFDGGKLSNVIPDSVELKGTLRTLDDSVRAKTIEKVKQIATAIGAATGATFEVDFGVMVPAVVADEEMTEIAQRACVDLLGADNVLQIPSPSMGGEDFAFYTQKLPASFVRIGCAGETTGHLPLHNSGFDIDERALAIGAKVMSRFAVEYLSS